MATPDPQRVAQTTLRVLRRLGAADGPTDRGPWPSGQLPNRAYVVVDGLGTRSRPVPGGTYRPWIEVLDPLLRGVDPPALIRGFSYAKPGHHYFPDDTYRSIRFAARRLARHHGPLRGLPTTYLAFSLGGAVSVLGLASWLASHEPAGDADPEALILLQPAFAASAAMRHAARADRGAPLPLRQLAARSAAATSASGLAVTDEILERLAAVTKRLPVHLLYWPGDEIVAFGEPLPGKLELPALLRSAGVTVEPPLAGLAFPPERSHPFQRHSDVAAHEEVLAALLDLLRRRLGLPTMDPPASG